MAPPFFSGWWLNTGGGEFIRWLRQKTAQSVVADGLPALYPRLWRFCLVLTKDRSSAEDLAQMTCERALAQAARFQPGTTLDRWLFTIARRIWLNDIRAARLRQGAGQVSVEDCDLPDTKPATETNIFAREVFERVQALPDALRITTVLVYVEGYSYREAAALLDIPIGTVMSRLASARKTIATQVDETGQKT